KVEVPTAFTWFNDPLQPHPPRSLVVKGYNVVRWTEMARGGHFPALEEPELLARSCAAGRGRRRLDDVPTSRRREQFSSMERLLSDSLLHAAEHSLEAYRVARSISGLDQVIRAAGASRVGRKRRDEILLQR
ncbi:MAG TPA: hypothetical protein VGN97_00070, partial [Mesorhizobium sp.]|nr:hypothetical protein [Mesorhizobium sp.]